MVVVGDGSSRPRIVVGDDRSSFTIIRRAEVENNSLSEAKFSK